MSTLTEPAPGTNDVKPDVPARKSIVVERLRALAGDWKLLLAFPAVFIAFYFLPVENARFTNAVQESLHLTKWYAREHVLLCLVPAFFIAGAIGVFVSQASVMKYLGPKASKPVAYGVASVSGSILAVCSCTVLPLFAGIWRMGAGLGPAATFLYAGPAINVLAIILTARILGLPLGIARATAAVAFSVVIGLLMHLIYRKEEAQKHAAAADMPVPPVSRPLWQNVIYFALMVAVLVFANWGEPGSDAGFWHNVHRVKWLITGVSALGLAVVLVAWFGMTWWKLALTAAATAAAALWPEPVIPFSVAVIGLALTTATEPGEAGEWFSATWGFAKQIAPLLFFGVLVSGFLLGRPDHEGIIPSSWVASAVGGNSLWANFLASLVGAFMYFATLTEVPIVQGLMGSNMGEGPALALLLAGPALSLPSMLVLQSIMGTRKTIVFVGLVVACATLCGWIFGLLR